MCEQATADLQRGLDRLIAAVGQQTPASRRFLKIWLGTDRASTPLHYDTQHNVYAQLHGSKDFWILPIYAARQGDVHLWPRSSTTTTMAESTEFGPSSQPFQFGQLLASNDKVTRDKAVKSLTRHLKRSPHIDELELMRIWKALFYCMWHSDKPKVQAELAETLGALVHAARGALRCCTGSSFAASPAFAHFPVASGARLAPLRPDPPHPSFQPSVSGSQVPAQPCHSQQHLHCRFQVHRH